MAEAQRFEFRERRGARMLLYLIDSPIKRLLFALIVAAISGRPFAHFSEGYRWPYKLLVLEDGPTTNYISRYLGIPDQEEFMEVDPAALSATCPNTDHFYRTVAARVKNMVGDPRTEYWACVVGSNMSCACGWPLVSRRVSYSVDVWEEKRFDGKPVRNYGFIVGEDGLDPVRPWGWWGNAVFGGILSGVIMYVILTLVAMGLQRSLRPVAGFPVIVHDQST